VGARSNRRRDDWLARALVGWLDFVLRRRAAVLVAIVLATAASGVYSARNLGFNLDPNDLFSPELRFQRMIVEFERHFPVLTNALLVVVDGDTPESTREVADELVGRLRARSDLFTSVYFPGEETFFESHGLLYTDLDDLDTFADEMARLQPVIGALSRDPSLVELSRVIRLGLEHVDEETWDVERWQSVLDHFRRATVAVYAELPLSISWETVLLEGSPLDPTLRRVIVAYPVLEFERILAASRPLEAIREEALESGAGPESGVRVRITGYPALNHEEFLGLARDTGIAGALSFALIVVVLFVAFRSFTVVTMAAGTLLVGFVWTAGYAAYTVERLNPASIAFAVLFIGLGVDFLIHIGMILVDELRGGTAVRTALEDAVRAVGSALVLCAFTTAIGFLAFFPTDYRGVSELGVISAGGMVVILFLTLTLFPIGGGAHPREAPLVGPVPRSAPPTARRECRRGARRRGIAAAAAPSPRNQRRRAPESGHGIGADVRGSARFGPRNALVHGRPRAGPRAGPAHRRGGARAGYGGAGHHARRLRAFGAG
jgi:hypothetical protein